jgi:5-methylthioadenosine/S-adenosylhomocysteine deaminase
VRKQHFSGNSGLVTMQMAARGPTFAVMEQVARDLATARDLGLWSTMHDGNGEGVVTMHEAKLTGPDITYVHLQSAKEEPLKIIKETGGKVSVSTLNEEWKTPWRGSNAATFRLLRQGILPSLSVDTETVVPGDMFSSMRGTLQSARYGVSNDPTRPTPAKPFEWNPASVVPTRRILEMATVGGAAPCGLEGQVGMLAPGMQADIVLLRASHLNYFPVNDAIGAIVVAADTGSVDAVFVAGKALKYNGRLVNDALVRKARRLAVESRDYLFARAGMTVPEGLGSKT